MIGIYESRGVYNLHLGFSILSKHFKFVHNTFLLDTNKIIIGNRVLIAPDVKIYTSFHSKTADERFAEICGKLMIITTTKPVEIGDDAWIGGGAIILPGVKIGSNVVIGADSVVTHDIPANSVAVGNPCRVITQSIQELTGADIYEIIPEDPYTDEDLNYNNSDCRANLEQNDDSARPAISGTLPDMSGYDAVFIGYPIWWGKLPTIKRLNAEYAELLSEKKANYAEYVALQKEVREMLLHKQNYEYILGIEPDKNEKTDREHGIEKYPFQGSDKTFGFSRSSKMKSSLLGFGNYSQQAKI